MTGTITIGSGSTTARIRPDSGFNCESLTHGGFDYLRWEPNETPTSGGIPVLFPWPNRIAGATWSWQATTCDLPVTEHDTGASLHGYACHSAWRVLAAGPDRVTGEFLMSRDAPAAAWPADAGLRVTYQVEPGRLLATAEVFCPDGRDLPYGLGFHPYLRVPGPFDQWELQVSATRHWPLTDDLVPVGHTEPVDARTDFTRARRLADVHLDDVLTALPGASRLTRRAMLRSPAATVHVSSDPAFREYVLYTPSSRTSVAIEPYTCASDAVHLTDRGVDAGWRILPAGRIDRLQWSIDIL